MNPILLTWIFVTIGYLMTLYIEHRRHLLNLSVLETKGVMVAKTKWRKVLSWSLVMLVLVSVLEPMIFNVRVGPIHRLSGLVLLLVSSSIRWYAISAIGLPWTKDVVFWRGQVYVKSGPYRFWKHPEYFSYIFDFIGFCFIVGSPRLALIGAALIFVIARRLTNFEYSCVQRTHLTQN